MRYLVTGGAGFIGSHLADTLLRQGHEVICLDNFNDYYAPERKRQNIAHLSEQQGFALAETDFRDRDALEQVFQRYRPERVAHLGAMANPRYSVTRPFLYEDVNIRGTMNLLEMAARYDVQDFVLASTSSVYGRNPTPWSESLLTDQPLSPYAATKKSAELLTYTYHNQYGFGARVVRFFTVYGPRGRPDMTPMLFVGPMLRGEPITLFNGGVDVYRDWTYIDDIVAGVIATLEYQESFEVFNLGNSTPVELRTFVRTLEGIMGVEAKIESRPLSESEPTITYADTSKAERLLGFAPQTDIDDGLRRFWDWYRSEALR